MSAVIAWQDAGRPYTSWPTKYEHDAARNLDVALYNSADLHNSADQRVFCRTRTPGGAWSNPRPVTGDVTVGFTHCDGFVILASGDYLAFTISRNSGLSPVGAHIRRSTDGGQTWANLGQVTESGTPVVPFYGGHMGVTSAGRILCLGVSQSGFNTFMWRFEEEAPTVWTASNGIDRSAIGNPQYCSECRILEHGGELIAIARQDITGDYTTPMRAVFSKSTDGGLNWSAWAYCTPSNVVMVNGNMAGVFQPTTGHFDLYWSSRLALADSKGSIWHSKVSAASLFAGNIGSPRRIYAGAPNRDFGYPGVIRRPDGSGSLIFYDGTTSSTAIYEIALSQNNDARNLAYVSGAHVRR